MSSFLSFQLCSLFDSCCFCFQFSFSTLYSRCSHFLFSKPIFPTQKDHLNGLAPVFWSSLLFIPPFYLPIKSSHNHTNSKKIPHHRKPKHISITTTKSKSTATQRGRERETAATHPPPAHTNLNPQPQLHPSAASHPPI